MESPAFAVTSRTFASTVSPESAGDCLWGPVRAITDRADRMEGTGDADSCRQDAGRVSHRSGTGDAPAAIISGERTVKPMDFPSLRVVVADDCAAARATLLTLLDAVAGVQVVGFAANGGQAVDAVHVTCPDAVFLDIAMPVMDGLQAAAEIGSRHPEVKVIVHAASDPSAVTLLPSSRGPAGYFRKATTTAELLDQLRQVFPTRGWAIKTQAAGTAARGGPSKSAVTARSVGPSDSQPTARYQRTSRPSPQDVSAVRCIDAADLRRQVERTLQFVDPRSFDVPGIVADIVRTYGLVNLCDSVTSSDYSTLALRHYRPDDPEIR